jgi:nitroreductase
MVDCAIAAQNLLLAAHARGLGAVYVGIYPIASRMQELKDLLNLPDYILPLALISLGHPHEHKAPADRYNPVKIHRSRW